MEGRTIRAAPHFLHEQWDEGSYPISGWNGMPDAATSMFGTLFRCRLCTRIAMVVMLAIFIIEAVILIPSYIKYERDLLDRLEATGLATISGAFTLNGHYTGRDLLILAKVLSKRTEVVGGRMYESDGSPIGTFGESSELTVADAKSVVRTKVRRANGSRYEVVWPKGTNGLRHTMVARLDASWVQEELNAFVWNVAGMVALISAFVTLATMIILDRLVLSHLLRLRGRMLATAEDAGDPAHHTMPVDRDDELGDVIIAFNKMLARLSLNLTRLKENQKYLRDAKEMAEISDRAKSDFLANMSHELRTPLNAIIGFSGAMKEKIFGPVENEKYRGYVDNIHESGDHLLELINDLLDISVIEANKLELDEEELDVATMARASVRLVHWRAERHSVRLVNDVDDALPCLLGDERRVKQILLNLLTNAIKFTLKGGTVSLTARVEPDGALSMTVSDTGVGMNEAALVAAFAPFGHQDTAMVKDLEGVGLGLPLTKGLVEAHGGSLDVQSTPDVGTIATVRFPPERTIRVAALLASSH